VIILDSKSIVSRVCIGLCLWGLTSIGVAREVKPEVLACNYKAMVASDTQRLRQAEDLDWPDFHTRAKQVFKINEGLYNVLKIAEFVFGYIPKEMTATEVFNAMNDGCMQSHMTGIKDVEA